MKKFEFQRPKDGELTLAEAVEQAFVAIQQGLVNYEEVKFELLAEMENIRYAQQQLLRPKPFQTPARWEIVNLETLLGEAMGAASMCWNPTPSGVFDDHTAGQVVEALHKEIERRLNSVSELHSAEVSRIKKTLNEETERLRTLLRDRRSRIRRIMENYFPGYYPGQYQGGQEEGDVVAIARLDRCIARLLEGQERASGGFGMKHKPDPVIPDHPAPKVVAGMDFALPEGITILHVTPCGPCKHTGRTQDDRPGEQGFYGEDCQYCNGVGWVMKMEVPVPGLVTESEPTEQELAEQEPFANDSREMKEMQDRANAYMEVWSHYHCAYNAVRHRESSQHYIACLTALTSAILGIQVDWNDYERFPFSSTLDRAKGEMVRLVHTISVLRQANSDLKKIIESFGREKQS